MSWSATPGTPGRPPGIDAITDEEWQRTIDINLTGQYRFAHYAVDCSKRHPARN
jgi:NAD(P)-dependent dehydrogenase (short-subunit alcohol dehydrogenase family)